MSPSPGGDGSRVTGRFVLRGRDVANCAKEPAVVEPVDPLQRGELEVIAAAPGTTAVDQLRLVEPDHRLGQGVIVRVAPAAD